MRQFKGHTVLNLPSKKEIDDPENARKFDEIIKKQKEEYLNKLKNKNG